MPKTPTTITEPAVQPHIFPRDRHNISRRQISANALKVLYRLDEAGYRACLVGGGVRDLLLGREPKDFDIATDATPEEVRALFRNCRLIGRRFRLAHVLFGREIIEVATFRAQHEEAEDDHDGVEDEHGRILRDNVYGDIVSDARRRDFSLNALYYDIRDFSVIDYTGGMADLKAGRLRLIGDPARRYREDPVRMLRAVRFAAKLGLRIEPGTGDPMDELAGLLGNVAPARLFEEVNKLFLAGAAVATFELLRDYHLFEVLFPYTEEHLLHEADMRFVHRALENTDARVADGRPVTPAFLFAALLWPPVRDRAEQLTASGGDPQVSLERACAETVSRQIGHVSLPKRFGLPMREIWSLQPRFEQRKGRRPIRLYTHPRFRAAYDFLLLRAEVGEVDESLAQWWTEFQAVNDHGRQAMLVPATRRKSGRRKPRPRGGSGGPDTA